MGPMRTNYAACRHRDPQAGEHSYSKANLYSKDINFQATSYFNATASQSDKHTTYISQPH